MRYIDGFLIPIRKKNLPSYRRLAQRAGKIWREYGALEVRECVGDDLLVKGVFPFPKLAKLKRGETVVFSWVAYRSRKHRDKVNASIVKDPRIARLMADPRVMPFDAQRMVYGGFKVLVDL